MSYFSLTGRLVDWMNEHLTDEQKEEFTVFLDELGLEQLNAERDDLGLRPLTREDLERHRSVRAI